MKQEEACSFHHLGSMLLQVGLEEDGSDPLPRVMLLLSHGFNFPFLNSSELASEKHNIPFAGIIFLFHPHFFNPSFESAPCQGEPRAWLCHIPHTSTLSAMWELSLGEGGLSRRLDLRR